MDNKLLYLIIVISLFHSIISQAQDETPITINLSTAGTLSGIIGDKADSIVNLSITGDLNGTDIITIHNMDRLSILNLTDANIVSGGDYYYYIDYHVPMSGYYRYFLYSSNDSIGNYMFESCLSLTSLILPKGVKSVGYGAFSYCKKLKSIFIPNGVLNIYSGAFRECTALTYVVIPNSVKSIGDYAFNGCSNLTSITLSDEITSIEPGTFLGCLNLKLITIPSKVTSMGSYVFDVGLIEIHTKALVPPVANSTFTMVDKTKCELYVPKGTSNLYRSAAGWSSFFNIKEEVPTANSDVQVNKINVFSENRTIVINGADLGDEITVYNAMGVMVQRTKTKNEIVRIMVPVTGIYLVKIGEKTIKVKL